MGASTGAAYAVANPGVAGVKMTQQNGACTGVVVDATGETVIGASVIEMCIRDSLQTTQYSNCIWTWSPSR